MWWYINMYVWFYVANDLTEHTHWRELAGLMCRHSRRASCWLFAACRTFCLAYGLAVAQRTFSGKAVLFNAMSFVVDVSVCVCVVRAGSRARRGKLQAFSEWILAAADAAFVCCRKERLIYEYEYIGSVRLMVDPCLSYSLYTIANAEGPVGCCFGSWMLLLSRCLFDIPNTRMEPRQIRIVDTFQQRYGAAIHIWTWVEIENVVLHFKWFRWCWRCAKNCNSILFLLLLPGRFRRLVSWIAACCWPMINDIFGYGDIALTTPIAMCMH